MIETVTLIPPFRFCPVEETLYRGAYPTLKNFRFLRRLTLKTIISIIPEEPTIDLAEFCEREGIALHHFCVEKFSDSVSIAPSTVAQILTIALQPERHPMYIHCLDGSNVCGVVFMLLRKLQNWHTTVITTEFCRFSRDHTIEKSEVEYFNSFSEDIKIPEKLPQWMWNDLRLKKHPTMNIKSADGVFLPMTDAKPFSEAGPSGQSQRIDDLSPHPSPHDVSDVFKFESSEHGRRRRSRLLEALDLAS